MTTSAHQRFLEDYCLPDRHYSFEQAPLVYLRQSKNASKENLDKAMSDINPNFKIAAASHPNATKEHLDKALADTDYWIVRRAAAEHPNATKEHLDKALNDDNWRVKFAAASHPNYKKYYPNGHE